MSLLQTWPIENAYYRMPSGAVFLVLRIDYKRREVAVYWMPPHESPGAVCRRHQDVEPEDLAGAVQCEKP